jgi:Cdc6-like AAA superfamily ATPase
MKNAVIASTPNRQRELMRQSYYLGAVSTVTVRLREQKEQTPVTPGALVPVKEGLIKKAMEELGVIRTIRSRKSYINTDAYSSGQADGRQVGIRHALESGGEAARELQ